MNGHFDAAKQGRVSVKALVIVMLCLAGPVRADDAGDTDTARAEQASDEDRDPPVSWSLQAGSEYDTNAQRLELVGDSPDDRIASPVFRLGASLVGRFGSNDGVAIVPNAFVGLKHFLTEAAQTEDVAVVSTSVQVARTLPSRMSLSAQGTYYDAIPVGDGLPGRNFRAESASAAITVDDEDNQFVTLRAGYRGLQYKSSLLSDFQWRGDDYSLTYGTRLWSSKADGDVQLLELRLAYWLQRRRYRGRAHALCVPDHPRCSAGMAIETYPLAVRRADLHHVVSAQLSYTGKRLYQLGYTLRVNDSNSYGQSIVRNRVDAAFTSELPWGLFLTAKLSMLWDRYLQPVALASNEPGPAIVSVDDDNRNAASVHLIRDIGKHWAVEARYVFVSNEFTSTDIAFRRQTAYAGLSYQR